MNENQLLSRINNVVGQDNRALLARFWLQMDDHPMPPPFNFTDFRHLDGESRCIFHSILSSYLREQFSPLDALFVYRLNALAKHHDYRHIIPSDLLRFMYFHPVKSASIIDAKLIEHQGVNHEQN